MQPPDIVDEKSLGQKLLDSNRIGNTIKKYFEIQMKFTDKHMYTKLYLDWVDRLMPLCRGYKTPDFTTFFCEDDKSTINYIERLKVYYSEGNYN